MPNLPRSDQALKVCREHAADASNHSTAATWSQVEAVLASYVASVIYAESEASIIKITAARAAHGSVDNRLQSFARVASQRLIRSIKISELAGTLGHFDTACKAHFAESLTAKQKTDWDSLVGTRHDVAHESAQPISTLTLNDVGDYYESVREVIEIYEVSLHI